MNFLFYRADARLLAILRIAIGTWFLIDILSMLLSGYVREAYIEPKVNFPFYGFEWVTPLPGSWMYVLFICLAIFSVLIIIGYHSRIALILFLIGFSYVFLIDIPYTLNKFYLLLLLAFYLSLLPVDRNLSIRTKKNPLLKINTIPSWMILMFQVQLAIIYIFSGIAKLNPDWLLQAQPLNLFFSGRWPFTYFEPVQVKYAAYAFSYGGVLFDLIIIFLLWNKRTRTVGQWWQTAFHLLNFVILHIGSLSIFMCLLTWLLFPTEWLKKKLKFYTIKKDEFDTPDFIRKRVAVGLSLLLIIHLLLPLRHHVSGNDVNWTEKGHRFSWRLMSRSKNGSRVTFKIRDRDSGEQWNVKTREYVTWRQYRKMSAETDLVIYFAHYLKKEWSKKGYDNIEITARVMTSINGEDPKLLIPEDLDLTKVSRSFLVDNVSLPRKSSY